MLYHRQKRIKRKCAYCGKYFNANPFSKEKQKYCNPICRINYYNTTRRKK